MSRFVRLGGAWVQVDAAGGGVTPFDAVDSTDSPDTANSRGVALTRPTSDNTLSPFTTVIASTSTSAGAIALSIGTPAPFPASFGERITALVDIAYGSGNTVVAENLLIPAYAGTPHSTVIVLPCDIPAGEPVKLRYRCSSDAADIFWYASVHVFGPTRGTGSVTTHGANTADSGGTAVDGGASANTEGAWVQFAASTAVDYSELFLMAATNSGGRSTTAIHWLVDIGIGASTAETVLIGDLYLSGEYPSPSVFRIPIEVPAGTRLSVRARCNSTDPEDRQFDAVLLGVT